MILNNPRVLLVSALWLVGAAPRVCCTDAQAGETLTKKGAWAVFAEFIKANRLLGKGETLALQEAWNVAQYVNSHERPSDPRLKK